MKTSIDINELKQVKAIFCDCDGTLLSNESRLSPRTIEAVKSIKDKVSFFLCSGRNYPAMIKLYDELSLTTPMITINGAVIVDQEENIISEVSLPKKVTYEILTVLKEYESRLSISLYSQTKWYVNDSENPYVQKEMLICNATPDKRYESLDEALCYTINKLLLIGDADLIIDLKNRLSIYKDRVMFIQVYPNYLEVCPLHADKGSGVKAILGRYHYSPDEILVCGDTLANEPMFKVAKYKACPENAVQGIKDISNVYLPSNDEDGVASLLETWNKLI